MPDATTPTAADWIAAYRRSHDRLAAAAAPLTEEQLKSQSYAADWSVAQVLSHLGSGATIFDRILTAGLEGADAPGMDVMKPIWAVWDAKGPVEMRDDALAADAALVAHLESLTAEQAEAFAITLWMGPAALLDVARLRVSEHALHTWDVVVTFDPTDVVADDAVALILPGLGAMAGRAGKPADPAYAVLLATTDGRGDWLVSAGDPVSLTLIDAAPEGDAAGAAGASGAAGTAGAGGAAYDGVVRLPSEALLRLVAGRLDPAHTPDGVTETGTRGLADLRTVFAGF